MSGWQQNWEFCRGCRTWQRGFRHRECPLGTPGSLVLINFDTFRYGCTKCGETWALEDTTTRCSCGTVQTTEYRDTVGTIQAGDQILATDGDLVYVLTRTGTVVVGYREYPGIQPV